MLANCQMVYNISMTMRMPTNCVNEDSHEQRKSGKHSGYVNSFKMFSVYQSSVEYPKVIVIILLICILSMIAFQEDFNNKVVYIMCYMLSRVLPSPFVELEIEHMLMALVSPTNYNDDLYSVHDVTESRVLNESRVDNRSQFSLC